jgi:hypothetical protein
MKGKLQLSYLEHNESKTEKPRARKKLAGPLNRLPRIQPSPNNAGRLLKYLIGQQRLQSMPHRAAKSSANLS